MTLISLKTAWRLTYAFIPRKTITGRRIWLKPIYKRELYYVKITEVKTSGSFAEYGTIFDVIVNQGISPHSSLEE